MEKVLIYSFTVCPYCTRAKNLLSGLNIPYKEIVVSPTDTQTRADLEKKTKMRTFPQIFINDQLVGGYTELQALHDAGKLLPLL